MVQENVRCIHCQSEEIVRNGKQANGIQRCKCKRCGKYFQLRYENNGAKPDTKKMIAKMSMNGSGIRDIARVLEISSNTVLAVLKKTKETG